jgi:ABC-type polysaccharide/polyol phosphate export permease
MPSGTHTDAERWLENRPSRGLRGVDLAKLWRYRELAGFLAMRDLMARYKQAAFGVAWAIVQPLAAVGVFTIVFRRLAGVSSEGIPYPLFVLTGLAVWTFVSSGVNKATLSLVSNPALVTKVYFPRILAPIAATLPGLVDLIISLALLGVLMIFYGFAPGWVVLTLPVWIVGLLVTSIGVGLLLGTLNVSYRDVTQGIGLVIQMWLFLSPVAYPSTTVPHEWRLVYALNPLVGWIDATRWALLDAPWPGSRLLVSLISTLVIFVGAVFYFQAAERRFADVI